VKAKVRSLHLLLHKKIHLPYSSYDSFSISNMKENTRARSFFGRRSFWFSWCCCLLPTYFVISPGLETQYNPTSKISWTSQAEAETTVSITNRNTGEIIQGLLATDAGLDFLMQLKKSEIETLVACILDKVERGEKWIVNIS